MFTKIATLIIALAALATLWMCWCICDGTLAMKNVANGALNDADDFDEKSKHKHQHHSSTASQLALLSSDDQQPRKRSATATVVTVQVTGTVVNPILGVILVSVALAYLIVLTIQVCRRSSAHA